MNQKQQQLILQTEQYAKTALGSAISSAKDAKSAKDDAQESGEWAQEAKESALSMRAIAQAANAALLENATKIAIAGPMGPQGERGLTGPQGVQGPVGATGAMGPQGEQIKISAVSYSDYQTTIGVKAFVTGVNSLFGVPMGSVVSIQTWGTGPLMYGRMAAAYVVGNDWVIQIEIFKVTTTGATFSGLTISYCEIVLSALPGADGIGSVGLTGNEGLQGPQGVQGPIGLTGLKGDTGAIGPQGSVGEAGPVGVTALSGLTDVHVFPQGVPIEVAPNYNWHNIYQQTLISNNHGQSWAPHPRNYFNQDIRISNEDPNTIGTWGRAFMSGQPGFNSFRIDTAGIGFPLPPLLYGPIMVTGGFYRISEMGAGTTDFTIFGSSNNLAGTGFIYSNPDRIPHTGSGEVSNVGDLGNLVMGDWKTTFPEVRTGEQNSVYGIAAGELLRYGNYNSMFGNKALGDLTAGNWNDAFGYHAMSSLQIGGSNSAFGGNSLGRLQNGHSNLCIGHGAGFDIVTGDGNVVIGAYGGATIDGLNEQVLLSDGHGNLRVHINELGNANIIGSLSVNGQPVISGLPAIAIACNDDSVALTLGTHAFNTGAKKLDLSLGAPVTVSSTSEGVVLYGSYIGTELDALGNFITTIEIAYLSPWIAFYGWTTTADISLPALISLAGAPGANGATGPQGIQGIQGPVAISNSTLPQFFIDDGAPVIDCSLANNFRITLTVDAVIAPAIGLTAADDGRTITIIIQQDATGGRTCLIDSFWLGADSATIGLVANQVTKITGYYDLTANKAYCTVTVY